MRRASHNASTAANSAPAARATSRATSGWLSMRLLDNPTDSDPLPVSMVDQYQVPCGVDSLSKCWATPVRRASAASRM